MYYITYNDVITPQTYLTREDALNELHKIFPDLELNNYDVAFWPSMSARGNTKIQIMKYEGEIE